MSHKKDTENKCRLLFTFHQKIIKYQYFYFGTAFHISFHIIYRFLYIPRDYISDTVLRYSTGLYLITC